MTNPKVTHVTRAKQTRRHGCHWPGCNRQVPPAMWGCKEHWLTLPKRLRDRIWWAYEPGQEDRMDPSEDYMAVAQEIQDWIARRWPDGR